LVSIPDHFTHKKLHNHHRCIPAPDKAEKTGHPRSGRSKTRSIDVYLVTTAVLLNSRRQRLNPKIYAWTVYCRTRLALVQTCTPGSFVLSDNCCPFPDTSEIFSFFFLFHVCFSRWVRAKTSRWTWRSGSHYSEASGHQVSGAMIVLHRLIEFLRSVNS
jgi:hypothetical protein